MADDPSELEKQPIAALAAEPIGPQRLDRREIGHAPAYFAALHGQEDGRGIAIADHQLDVEPERIRQDSRHVVAGGAVGGAAEQ